MGILRTNRPKRAWRLLRVLSVQCGHCDIGYWDGVGEVEAVEGDAGEAVGCEDWVDEEGSWWVGWVGEWIGLLWDGFGM